MIETLKYALVSDIYVTELICYDPKNEINLERFCKNNGISYLPSKNLQSVYKYSNGTFVKKELTDDLQCKPYDRIFDENTLLKFENNNHDEVLFVTENNKIKGVVHIIDYNHEFIYFEFYKLMFYFERMLRDYLMLMNESNETLLCWMKERSQSASKERTRQYWTNRYIQNNPDDPKKKQFLKNKREDFRPFQTFLLSDLLEFASHKKYISKNFRGNVDNIKSLRNWVAHNKDITNKKGSSSKNDFNENQTPLYIIEDLKKFVKGINGFFEAFEELQEKLNEKK